MTNSEIQNILIKLQRATCCGKLKVVDELPEGNLGNGFVVFEDELYYWDGDEWIVVGGGGALPTFKTINGETIDDGPGDIVVGGTGLETLDEGNGFGWRLVGRNAANYGDIGENGVDFSFQDGSSTTLGAVGEYSTAFGLNTWASGSRSMVWGQGATASAAWSTAWGAGSIASGLQSTAWGISVASGTRGTSWGVSTQAAGIDSTAWGNGTYSYATNSTSSGLNTRANAFCSTVIGMNSTIAAGQYFNNFFLTDELFKIGNGPDAGNRSDAFLILKDGTITAPSLTNALITTAGNKALITKEYLDANAGSSTGLEAINEGNGVGWRLIGKTAANYGNIGFAATDFSQSTSASATKGATGYVSTAFGYNTTSSGFASVVWGRNSVSSGAFSTAWGDTTQATGSNATAWGYNTQAINNWATSWGHSSIASGQYSTAFGLSTNSTDSCTTAWGRATTASGKYSTAFGRVTQASAENSVAFGYQTVSNSYACTVLGHSSTIASGQTINTVISTDELFKIGNGVNTSNRSDALTIYKNAVQKVGGITATAASALTPQAGMIAYVTSTDATFVTTGFWKYQGGAWSPF